MKFLDPGNCNCWTACSGDFGTHPGKERCQIYNFRLARGTFDGCDAVGEDRRHHHVPGAQDSGSGPPTKENIAPAQVASRGIYVATLDCYDGAQISHSFEMQIDWPRADNTTSRQGNFCLSLATKQWAEDANRPPHFADQIVVAHRLEFAGADRHRIAFHTDPSSK